MPLRHDYPMSIELDARAVTFVVPTFLLRLRTFIDWHREQGRAVKVLPPRRAAVRSYLARMRINEHLPSDAIPNLPEVRKDRPSEVLIPVRQLREFDDLENLNELELVPVLHSHFDDVAALRDAVFMAVSELCGNAIEHGASSTGCYVAAQRYDERRRLVLAIADLGPGIPEHLRGHYPDLGSGDGLAISRATEEHVTGTGDAVRGLGFTEVFGAALDSLMPSGEMRIRSCRGACRIRLGDDTIDRVYEDGHAYKKGTWITFELEAPVGT
jgi:hypothetical protein